MTARLPVLFFALLWLHGCKLNRTGKSINLLFGFFIICLIISNYSITYPSDLINPSVEWVDIIPETVNTGGSIEIRVFANDDDYGSGIKNILACLASPSGKQKITNINLAYSNGHYSAYVTIPAYVESGTWELESLALQDNAGNMITCYNYMDYYAECDVNGTVADIIPPDFGGISVSPYIVEAGSSITITVSGVSDDISGVESIYCTIKSSAVQQNKEVKLSQAQPGVYLAVQYIPEYVKSGYWNVNRIKIADKALNSKTSYYGQDYTQGVFIVTSFEDVFPPVITNPEINKSSILLPDVLKVSCNITDDFSGFGKGEVNLASPNGKILTGNIYYNSSSRKYEASFYLSNYEQAGVWSVSSIRVEDVVQNTTTYYHGKDYSLPFLVNADNPPTDTTPPAISNVSFTPGSVNVEESVTVQCTVTDDWSGVGYVHAYIVSPIGRPNYEVYLSPQGGNVYKGVQKIDKWVKSGTWQLSYIEARDNFNNKTRLDTNINFIVTSYPEDLAPPVVSQTQATPVVNSGQTVTISCNITDDLSGPKYAGVGFVNRATSETYNMSFNYRFSVDLSTGTHETYYKLPENCRTGTYDLSIFVLDNAGNTTVYPNQAAIQVNSNYAPDITPPVVSNVQAAPERLRAGENLLVSCNIVDDKSDITLANATLVSPTSRQKYTLCFYTNASTGKYEGRLTIPLGVELGQWKVEAVTVSDSNSNSRAYSGGTDFTCSFMVLGHPEDLTPPEIKSVEATPGAILAGESIVIIVKATDTPAGIDWITCNVISPSGSQGFWNVPLKADHSTAFWTQYSTTIAINPLSETGAWKISRINSRDLSWNNGEYLPSTVFNVTVPSIDGSITINNGNAFTDNETVKLDLNITGTSITQMQFSNTGAGYGGFEQFSSTKSWVIDPANDGEKTVYAKFIYGLGSLSGAFSGKITLDKTPPGSLVMVPDGRLFYNYISAVSGKAADNYTIEKVEVRIKNTDDNLYWDGTGWASAETWVLAQGTDTWSYGNVPWQDQRRYAVSSRARDCAGNLELVTGSKVFMYIAPANRIEITGLSGMFIPPTTNEITVEILNEYGHRVINYSGKVKLTSSDNAAVMPADYTFTPGDQGTHSFSGIQFNTSGRHWLEIKDEADAGLSGNAGFIIDGDPPAGSIMINCGEKYLRC